jgi:prepilin-type processing-associated H-X9-DG protein
MKVVRILICLVAALLLFICFWPIGGTPKEQSKKTACLSNLKQLSLLLTMYAGDNDGLTPKDDWAEALTQGKDRYKFLALCPTASTDKLKGGFALSLAMAGVKIPKSADPERTITFFETDALGPSVISNLAARNRDRHDGGSHVAYLDGHAKRIPEDEEPG